MSSPAYEAFFVRILLDATERERFLADPAAVARSAGLAEEEVASLAKIDRAGLLMAAESLQRKRAKAPRRTSSRRHWVIGRLRDWVIALGDRVIG